MELPHSGDVPAAGTCSRTYSSTCAPASASVERRRLDLGQQPRLRVHRAHEVVHLGERVGRLVHDEVDAVVERLELVVGDERRDLDDHVALDVETGHLEIEPHQGSAVVARPFVGTGSR